MNVEYHVKKDKQARKKYQISGNKSKRFEENIQKLITDSKHLRRP